MGIFGSSDLVDIPIAGPLLFDDPNEKRLQDAMARMKAAYEAYRPKVEAARMGALNQQLGAFDQSINPELNRLFGQGSAINTGLLGQNPLDPLPMGAPPPMDAPTQSQSAAPGEFVSQGGRPPPTPFPQDEANRRIVDEARQAQANRNRKSNPFHNPSY